MAPADSGEVMAATRTYRKKYVRFRWWQYGRWVTLIAMATFLLGFAAGFFAGQIWNEIEKVQPSVSSEQPSR